MRGKEMQGRKKAFMENVSHTLSLTQSEIYLYDPFFLFSRNSGIIISEIVSSFTDHKMGYDQAFGPRSSRGTVK